MIEADYLERMAAADDKDSVARRKPQEILDDRFNRLQYNELRRIYQHAYLAKVTPQDMEEDDDMGRPENKPDFSDMEERTRKDDEEDFRDRLYAALPKEQADLLWAVCVQRVPVGEYAAREGVTSQAISHRLATAKKNAAKIFRNPHI